MLNLLFTLVESPVGIFGVPLQVSIRYANVAISLTNEHGENYVYGYVPIVIAKCGVFLKERGKSWCLDLFTASRSHFILATDVEGIFRLSGSAKRIKELQVAFDSPDRYGKGLDWSGYTVHDAANILRRYLNMLPQPIVPHEFYERFRDPLRSHQAQAVGDIEAQAHDAGDFDPDSAIKTYQRLITELPPLNRQLLLYILDLLAVFASKSELNRMTSPNLAAIFQPGMLSHPNHDMIPAEYRLSQDIIIFLIENQDSFLVGMSGTAVDENTVREVQSGLQRQSNSSTRVAQVALGRSTSNASAGADSLRKQGGIRRNVSVSSKNSRASSNVPSPGSPSPATPLANSTSSGGVHRSNTVPSKRSPGLPSGRFRIVEPLTPTSSKLVPSGPLAPAARSASPETPVARSASGARSPAAATSVTSMAEKSPILNPVPESKGSDVRKASRERTPSSTGKLSLRTLEPGVTTTITAGSSATPSKERKNLFSKSPSSDTERKDSRQPNKLRKKRIPESSPNASAQSSTHSLHGTPESPAAFYTPLPTPGGGTHVGNDTLINEPPTISNTDATPSSERPPRIGEIDKLSTFHISQPGTNAGGSPAMKPTGSPPGSITSKTSVTEDSELDHGDDIAKENKPKKKHRWRLSTSTAKNTSEKRSTTPAGSRLGSTPVAGKSTTSILSEGRPRKSIANESISTQIAPESLAASGPHVSSAESTPWKEKEASREKDSGAEDKEKRGPIGWLKGKVAKAKEDRKEREAEKERAKSPPRSGSEHATSKQSLDAITQETLPTRGRSTDAIAEASREEEEADPVAPIAKEP